MESEHLAIKANRQSIQMAVKGDKLAWLKLFDEDALLKDPVGISPLDPKGDGYKGIKAIASFWEKIIAPANLQIIIKSTVASGDFACAVNQQVINELSSGQITHIDMIATYQVNPAGLIVSMMAYWNFDQLMHQLEVTQK